MKNPKNESQTADLDIGTYLLISSESDCSYIYELTNQQNYKEKRAK